MTEIIFTGSGIDLKSAMEEATARYNAFLVRNPWVTVVSKSTVAYHDHTRPHAAAQYGLTVTVQQGEARSTVSAQEERYGHAR